jgi:hypothetical protein
MAIEPHFTDRPEQEVGEKINSLIANSPDSNTSSVNEELEARMKMELLGDLSLDDIKQVVKAVKSGILSRPEDQPDSFDEYGRNFRRMVHLVDMVGPSGSQYKIERPMANSLEEARKQRPPADYFDPNDKCWIIRGVKRTIDYPENTVGFYEQTNGKVVPT